MSCLFSSLSYFHNNINTNQMRYIIITHLSKNPVLGGASASDIIKWETGKQLNNYVREMSSLNKWGTAIEIKAYCDLFKTNVKIKSYPSNSYIDFLSESPSRIWIMISWNGSHYEAINIPR